MTEREKLEHAFEGHAEFQHDRALSLQVSSRRRALAHVEHLLERDAEFGDRPVESVEHAVEELLQKLWIALEGFHDERLEERAGAVHGSCDGLCERRVGRRRVIILAASIVRNDRDVPGLPVTVGAIPLDRLDRGEDLDRLVVVLPEPDTLAQSEKYVGHRDPEPAVKRSKQRGHHLPARLLVRLEHGDVLLVLKQHGDRLQHHVADVRVHDALIREVSHEELDHAVQRRARGGARSRRWAVATPPRAPRPREAPRRFSGAP